VAELHERIVLSPHRLLTDRIVLLFMNKSPLVEK